RRCSELTLPGFMASAKGNKVQEGSRRTPTTRGPEDVTDIRENNTTSADIISQMAQDHIYDVSPPHHGNNQHEIVKDMLQHLQMSSPRRHPDSKKHSRRDWKEQGGRLGTCLEGFVAVSPPPGQKTQHPEAPSLGHWECGPLCKLSNFSGKEFLNHTCSQDQAAMTVYTAPPCGDDDAMCLLKSMMECLESEEQQDEFFSTGWLGGTQPSSPWLLIGGLTTTPQCCGPRACASALAFKCRPYLMPAFLKSHAICGSGFVLEKGTTDSLEPNKKDLFIQIITPATSASSLCLGPFPAEL
ncbi:hypothetical protein U0070_006771, partial [Myodes glareolus]